MKRNVILVTAALFMVVTLSACGKKNSPEYKSSMSDSVEIIQSVSV